MTMTKGTDGADAGWHEARRPASDAALFWAFCALVVLVNIALAGAGFVLGLMVRLMVRLW
jgi:hypothetical protein